MPVFRQVEDFRGQWILANHRVIKFTDNPKEMLFDLGTYPLSLINEGWNMEGKSKIDPEFDIVERVREGKGL